MKPALIFDLDGTLWNTVSLCADAWNTAISKAGVAERYISPSDVQGSMGLAFDELRSKIFPELELEAGRKLVRACFAQEIVELDRRGATFFPGVLELIPRLSRIHELFVVSNCDGDYLKAFFRVSGLTTHFKDAECHGSTGLTKGENIQLVLRRNSLSKAIYVGDTLGDQKAAELAGTPFIYARYGFGQCTRFDGVIDSFTELETLLDRPL